MRVMGPIRDHAIIQTWAEAHRYLPGEKLPAIVDSEPAMLRLLQTDESGPPEQYRVITWEDFFMRFDQLGLSFVYDEEDEDGTGFYNILQDEARSPYAKHMFDRRDIN